MKNKFIVVLIASIVFLGGVLFFYNQKQENRNTFFGVAEKVYVAAEGTGEIVVIDAKTNNLFKRIDLSENKNGKNVGYMAHNVQVALNGKSVWVTANAMDKNDKEIKMSEHDGHEEGADKKNNDEVIIIDPFTDTIIKRIEIGQDLHLSHIVLTPDSSYAIVASQDKGIIYKINAISFRVEKEVVAKKGAEPHGLRVSPDGKTAYIAMIGDKSMGILDIESFSFSGYISLKGSAVQTGVTPDGKYALVSVYDTKSLAVYDIISSKLNYVDLPKEAKGPVQIYPTPDSRYVYIADQGYYFNQPVGDKVYKIDLQEMKVVQTVKGGSAPHGVVISQDGKFVYVTNLLSDDVSVIDADIDKEIARIKVEKMPNGISLWYSI